MNAQSSVSIHPTALVEPGAELDTGVSIGAYAFVGKNVKIGKRTRVEPHAHIAGCTTIGDENRIFSYAIVGNPPQDLKYKGEPTLLEIGHKNTIREFATLQTGTVQGGGKTSIGHENLFMCYTHVAHDCTIGDSNVLANLVQLAGHVIINNMTVIGGLSAMHQHVQIGDMAMIGAYSKVRQDVPPYCLVEGSTLCGLNTVAMNRRGITAEAKQAVKEAYKILFCQDHPTVEIAITALEENLLAFNEVRKLLEFVRASKRGVIRHRNTHSSRQEDE